MFLINTSVENTMMNTHHFKTCQRKATNPGLMKLFYKALLITLLLLPKPGFSAVPDQVNYQGLLKDDSGLPIAGSVNFDFAIFDTLTSGTQLWTETQNGVSVVNGIYSVALGSITPLTASILTGGTVYLETTVNGETLQPRERLLAVPYALRAQEADNVGGVSSLFTQQIFQHGSFDGGAPPNDDPREGLIDTDGDGKSNFIDSDNDNDGILDSAEVTNGTDINLVTPQINLFTGPIAGAPDEAIAGETNLFAITGTEFISGLAVQVGSENPAPQNLTSSSFDISVGPGQTIGQQNLIVTLPNGETATAGPITFRPYMPNITSFTGPIAGAPDEAKIEEANLFTITGTEFLPGLTVQVGLENPVPQNLTSTSFNITVGVGQTAVGPQDLIVTLPNGETDTAGPITFVAEEKVAFVSSGTLANALSQSAATADAFCTTAAANAGLTSNFVAWYSDATSNAKDRLPIFAAIRRIDGTLIVTTLADLTDGTISSTMSIDEFGAPVSGSYVATHTLASGDLAPDSCTGSNPAIGVVGRTSAVNSNWTQIGTESCSSSLRLYCFEHLGQ